MTQGTRASVLHSPRKHFIFNFLKVGVNTIQMVGTRASIVILKGRGAKELKKKRIVSQTIEHARLSAFIHSNTHVPPSHIVMDRACASCDLLFGLVMGMIFCIGVYAIVGTFGAIIAQKTKQYFHLDPAKNAAIQSDSSVSTHTPQLLLSVKKTTSHHVGTAKPPHKDEVTPNNDTVGTALSSSQSGVANTTTTSTTTPRVRLENGILLTSPQGRRKRIKPRTTLASVSF